ncbi:MAG: NAD-dependent epimerase/dehydratase family protein [Candidatus Galacturonibacter soehngenii]|nr:NAD-dependent epimerase/dehydratase family protein [Candidatus Galacturonibacter soehngenii]
MSKQANLIESNAHTILEKIDLSALQGKSILITGASGLIGIHFLSCLKIIREQMKEPFQVFGIVNRKPLAFVKEFFDYDQAHMLQGDLTDIDFLKSLPNVDYIIHAASYGQPIRFMENPLKTLKLNTLATYLLFEKLNEGGKFLFVSSSEVYIGLNTPPFKESEIGTIMTNQPRACYVEAKRCGEAIVNVYRRKGVDAKIVRLSATYGPGTRLDDKRVISSFIQKAYKGDLKLMDHGRAVRAYCYVTDAVENMWNVLLHGKDDIYNIGGIYKNTIAQVAEIIGELIDVSVVYPDIPDEVNGSPEESWLDVEKINNEFKKTNYVMLKEGIKKTVEWYQLLQELE